MIRIEITLLDKKAKISNKTKLIKSLTLVCKELGIKGDFTYIFISPQKMVGMNRKYLGHNYLTDILTFDSSIEKDFFIVDFFLCYSKIAKNAAEYNEPLERELNRVMIHGMLHIGGYNDKTKKQQEEMRMMEEYLLKKCFT